MKFVVGEPAAIVGENLVISDAHVGVELELQAKGIHVSTYESEAKRLNALVRESKCKRIIVLGDFKHDVYGFRNREFWVLKKFLKLLECKDVLVIKGNHDSELEGFSEVRVVDARGMLLEAEGKKYGLFHGHAFPSRAVLENADVFLFGNTHPLVEIREGSGGKGQRRSGRGHRSEAGDRFSYTSPVWLVGKTKENAKVGLKAGRKWVLFPAFSSLAGGVAVNREKDLGPFLKGENADLPNAEVFLLDGQKLGLLKNLR